jgi:hypothetical protein
MLGVGTVYPQLATVIYTTPTLTISPSFPSGTLATPTLLKGGALYTLEAYLTVLDVGSLTVKQVTISGTGYSQVVPLTWRHTVNYDKIDSVWTAPVLPDGILLTFVWHVESNVAGTVYKADATSYGKSGGPVGKFYINGQEANIDSTFTVSSPTLTLSFKCTQNGDLINGGVWIGIKCESPVLDTQVTLTETTADTEWTGTFTLPARGTYTLLGYISYGGNSYRLMSLLSTFGVTSIPQVNALQVIGGIMVIAGVAVEVLRKRAEVSRKGRRLSK